MNKYFSYVGKLTASLDSEKIEAAALLAELISKLQRIQQLPRWNVTNHYDDIDLTKDSDGEFLDADEVLAIINE